MLRNQLVLSSNSVRVVNGGGKVFSIRRTGRLAIAELCHDNDAMVSKGSFGKIQGGVDPPTETGRNQSSFGGGWIEFSICEIHLGECDAILKSEVLQFEVLDSGVVVDGGHYEKQRKRI